MKLILILLGWSLSLSLFHALISPLNKMYVPQARDGPFLWVPGVHVRTVYRWAQMSFPMALTLSLHALEVMFMQTKGKRGRGKKACAHTCRAFRYSTICNVFPISGIFCSSPLRLCAVLSSINLYFLQISTVMTFSGACIHVRDGVLKLFQRRHNIFVCPSNKFGHVCLPV